MSAGPNVICPNKIGPYQLRGTIGHGAFAICKLAYRQDTDKFYACKIIAKQRIDKMPDKTRFEQEIRILQQMRHPGIVQLYDLFKDTLNYYIMIEFCPNGELFSRIVDQKKLIEPEAKFYFYQILTSMVYIHSKKVAHRDLKPENILINEKGFAKVSDFGLSKFVTGNGLTSTSCGSPCYTAPDVISGRPYDPIKADMWSLGVILYVMVTGQMPWTKRNKLQLFDQIRSGEYKIPYYVSEKCANLIKLLMRVDPDKRITAKEAISHSFLENDERIQSFRDYLSTEQTPSVSLRMVDFFFEKEKSTIPISSLEIDKLSIYSSTGNISSSFQKVSNLLKNKDSEIDENNFASNTDANANANINKNVIDCFQKAENTNGFESASSNVTGRKVRMLRIVPSGSTDMKVVNSQRDEGGNKADFNSLIKMVKDLKLKKSKQKTLIKPCFKKIAVDSILLS